MPDSRLHVYTAPLQYATRFTDDSFDPPLVFEIPPRALVYCGRCRRRRWAAKCMAQAYYDGHRFWCRDVKACKKVKARP